jgi:hypothetical protein
MSILLEFFSFKKRFLNPGFVKEKGEGKTKKNKEHVMPFSSYVFRRQIIGSACRFAYRQE